MVEELKAGRNKRVAVWLVLMSVGLMVVAVSARHHLWPMFVALGVELIAVVSLMREVAVMQKGK